MSPLARVFARRILLIWPPGRLGCRRNPIRSGELSRLQPTPAQFQNHPSIRKALSTVTSGARFGFFWRTKCC
jgi:hypothetical protein